MEWGVSIPSDQTPRPDLPSLGWRDHFADQIAPSEGDLAPMRVATVHRDRMSAEGTDGPLRLILPPKINTAEFAVGDWVLVDPGTRQLVRRLDRSTLLQRRTEGGRDMQLIAANVDTLFIVTSCNDDFNVARLERYLALSNEAGTDPLIVLTKADRVETVEPFLDAVAPLQRGLQVVAVTGTDASAAATLAPWCGAGQTVALVGSSGVGKSSLLNTLTGKTGEDAQLTGGIRESDAKGRHTTTSRSLHRIPGGGCVIDTPGMRTLHVSDLSVGLDVLYAEITDLAPHCRFRNCTHAHEPGCAVQAAVADGRLDAVRVARWRKLVEENDKNTPPPPGPRGKPVWTGNKRR